MTTNKNHIDLNFDKSANYNNQTLNHDNTLFGIAALLLILINAFLIQDLIASLTQDSNVIDRLYRPEQEMEYFTVPVFIVVSLIVIWMITKDATPMKKMFKVTSIIGVVLFMLFSLVFMLLSSLKFNH